MVGVGCCAGNFVTGFKNGEWALAFQDGLAGGCDGLGWDKVARGCGMILVFGYCRPAGVWTAGGQKEGGSACLRVGK